MTSLPAVVRAEGRVEPVKDWNARDVSNHEGCENQYDCQNGHLKYLVAQPPHRAAECQEKPHKDTDDALCGSVKSGDNLPQEHCQHHAEDERECVH